LGIIIIIIKKKIENPKKKKRDENRGWLQPPPFPKWGGPATPFLAKGWRPPRPRGGPATRKGQKKKKKGFWTFGGGTGRPPPSPWGWSGHPQKSKTHFSFFFFFGPFGGGQTTPLGLGVVRPPQTGCGGGSSHPQFSSFSFFFVQFSSLSLSLSLFFLKKKKINGQTTSFWAGWVL
jgi:hypothetical protein